jgi:tetratricopeptide (TPR) repeat protein
MLGSLLAPALAAAGTASTRPAVQVTRSPSAPSAPDEDDVPGPAPELGPAHVVAVELPAIPELDRLPTLRPPPVARPPFKPIGAHARHVSLEALNACHAALLERRHAAAIIACRTSLTAWAGNHRAWYGWASAYIARGTWDAARAAVAQAVALRPDVAMYQMVYGIALYQTAWQHAPEAAADPRAKLDAAREALGRALALEPRLWRAHYYLGCLDRARHADHSAAEHFIAAIRLRPDHSAGYLALAELYRATGHAHEALEVATTAVARVSDADAASLRREVALAHDALNAERAAIAYLSWFGGAAWWAQPP